MATVGAGTYYPARQLQAEVRLVVGANLAAGNPALQQVSSGAPVLDFEVGMVDRHVEPLNLVRKPKADQATADPVEIERQLVFYYLDEGG